VTIFINKKGGRILFSQTFSNERMITSELYRSDIFEIMSILKGTKKAIIAASNAATSDKKAGLGFICPSQFRKEKSIVILEILVIIY
jgi:hypothetical protein